jgi:hypothetical protein
MMVCISLCLKFLKCVEKCNISIFINQSRKKEKTIIGEEF